MFSPRIPTTQPHLHPPPLRPRPNTDTENQTYTIFNPYPPHIYPLPQAVDCYPHQLKSSSSSSLLQRGGGEKRKIFKLETRETAGRCCLENGVSTGSSRCWPEEGEREGRRERGWNGVKTAPSHGEAPDPYGSTLRAPDWTPPVMDRFNNSHFAHGSPG